MENDVIPTILMWKGKRIDDMGKPSLIEIIHILVDDLNEARESNKRWATMIHKRPSNIMSLQAMWSAKSPVFEWVDSANPDYRWYTPWLPKTVKTQGRFLRWESASEALRGTLSMPNPMMEF